MLAKILSATAIGIDATIVEAEIDVGPGMPSFNIVGLPDTAVQEARERVRSALKNSGFTFPARRVTVNLAPASLRKTGSDFDLAIALGILAATGQTHFNSDRTIVVGELSLSGEIRPVHGILRLLTLFLKKPILIVVCTSANAEEGAIAGIVEVYGFRVSTNYLILNVNQLCSHHHHPQSLFTYSHHEKIVRSKGQRQWKSALEFSAAGVITFFFADAWF